MPTTQTIVAATFPISAQLQLPTLRILSTSELEPRPNGTGSSRD